MWGATVSEDDLEGTKKHFNPRSPCGERLYIPAASKSRYGISIHAPRVGSDSFTPSGAQHIKIFQSTLPVWGATWARANRCIGFSEFQSTLPVWGATSDTDSLHLIGDISIHAPRVGSDPWHRRGRSPGQNISIHAPRVGSDPNISMFCPSMVIFQSTLPVWGATRPSVSFFCTCRISIHAPRVGSDSRNI